MPRISSVRRIRQMEFFMYTYDIEQLLKNGSAVKLKPQGYSMYPLFLPGRDEAVIEHCVPSELHRGDVILYRRVQGILVLHRICRITRDGFYLVGDNPTEVDGYNALKSPASSKDHQIQQQRNRNTQEKADAEQKHTACSVYQWYDFLHQQNFARYDCQILSDILRIPQRLSRHLEEIPEINDIPIQDLQQIRQ